MPNAPVRALEQYQIVWYLLAITIGLVIGTVAADLSAGLELLLWPLLALLLYSTFTQIPLLDLRPALADRRFLSLALLGNFVILPVMVFGLIELAPDEPAIRLGVLLVLLVPCTDWFITFSHLGRGDGRYAIAFAPLSLLMQMALLPVYLWLWLPETFAVAVRHTPMLWAFTGLIVLPLILAYLTEKWQTERPMKQRVLRQLSYWPVPLLALVMLIITASQVPLVMTSTTLLLQLLPVFVGFAVLALLLAWLLSRASRLSSSQGRVLAFSFSSRNSFVVLPLALALPVSYELAVVTVVFQSLIELLLMALFVWLVPQLFTDSAQ